MLHYFFYLKKELGLPNHTNFIIEFGIKPIVVVAIRFLDFSFFF